METILQKALELSYAEAVQHINSLDKSFPLLTEEKQARLYGLNRLVKNGPAPKKSKAKTAEQRAQYAAHLAVSDRSKLQAMQEYVDLVNEIDPDFMWQQDIPEQGEEKKMSELPPPVQEALAKELKKQGRAMAAPGRASARQGAGKRSLLDAAENGLVSEVRRRLRKGEDPNQADAAGVTALMWAADKNNADLARCLLQPLLDHPPPPPPPSSSSSSSSTSTSSKYVLRIDQQDSEGQTALHYCAICGAPDIARMCLDAKADPSLKDRDGATALQVAVENCSDEMVAVLQQTVRQTAQSSSATTDAADRAGKLRPDMPLESAETRLSEDTATMEQSQNARGQVGGPGMV
eukprot:g22765.t1